MPLRIACDLDGTLADMSAALQREADRLFGEPVDVSLPRRPGSWNRARVSQDVADESEDSGAAERPRQLARHEQERLWNHVRGIANFWETLTEVEPGSVARFAAAATQQGWEVLFLTQRPDTAGDHAQLQSQRWLRANGFELPSVYVIGRESRGKIAASLSLDCVIDDRPENCLDVAVDSSATAVLVWRYAPAHPPPVVSRLDIHVVSSMADAIEYHTRLTARPARPRGIFGRLRHALLPS
jgi:hypothetical protein